MISLIIPATTRNREYTDFAVQKIRELYPDPNEVEVVVEENDDVSLGINYNNAVAKATGDIIILMHNDMVPHPGFVETILKYMKRKRVLVYHRVEPPIFNDLCTGKSIYDCGSDIKEYAEDRFFSYTSEDVLLDGGSQLFFAVYRDEYIGIDGNTFQKFCEDDDIHLRYKIAGFECKTANAAMVYHFVSKTSRNDNYREIEVQSNLNFIKKWGFRQSKHNKVYKKAVIFEGEPSNELMKALGLWFNEVPGKANVEALINVYTFTPDDLIHLTQLNDIIYENNEIGLFELGNVRVVVKSLDSFEEDFIFINK